QLRRIAHDTEIANAPARRDEAFAAATARVARTRFGRRRADAGAGGRQDVARSLCRAGMRGAADVEHLDDEVGRVPVAVQIDALVGLEREEPHGIVEYPIRHPGIARLELAWRDRLSRVENRLPTGRVVDLEDGVLLVAVVV